VTEMVTGIDIVRTQIKLAFGKKLAFAQEDVQLRGHAIEMRINAEDPQNDFMPEGGKTVSVYRSPGGYGVRLDGFVYQGFIIPERIKSCNNSGGDSMSHGISSGVWRIQWL